MGTFLGIESTSGKVALMKAHIGAVIAVCASLYTMLFFSFFSWSDMITLDYCWLMVYLI